MDEIKVSLAINYLEIGHIAGLMCADAGAKREGPRSSLQAFSHPFCLQVPQPERRPPFSRASSPFSRLRKTPNSFIDPRVSTVHLAGEGVLPPHRG